MHRQAHAQANDTSHPCGLSLMRTEVQGTEHCNLAIYCCHVPVCASMQSCIANEPQGKILVSCDAEKTVGVDSKTNNY